LDNTSYQPDALTPLYDAIGKTVAELEKEKIDKDCRVIFVIITDGQENNSREFDKAKIVKIIKEKEKVWTFVYLGADQDAWLEASTSIGISTAGSTMSFDTKDMKRTFKKLERGTVAFMSSSKRHSKEFVKDYMEGDTK